MSSFLNESCKNLEYLILVVHNLVSYMREAPEGKSVVCWSYEYHHKWFKKNQSEFMQILACKIKNLDKNYTRSHIQVLFFNNHLKSAESSDKTFSP